MKGLSWVLSKQTFQGCFPKKPLNTISWLVTDLSFVFLSFTGCRFCFRICSITGKKISFFFILPTLFVSQFFQFLLHQSIGIRAFW